jgi:hypothetical protein
VVLGGLQYKAGIRVGPILCLVVLQHLLLSGLNIQFQPSPGSVGYVDRILGEGNNSEGESAVACIVVLYATLYRMPGRCRRMQRSSITWIRGLRVSVGRLGGLVLVWNVSS